MTWDRVTGFFCVLFAFMLSLLIAWMGEVTDNTGIQLLAILAFGVTWWAAGKERQAVVQFIDEVERELAQLDDEEEDEQ